LEIKQLTVKEVAEAAAEEGEEVARLYPGVTFRISATVIIAGESIDSTIACWNVLIKGPGLAIKLSYEHPSMLTETVREMTCRAVTGATVGKGEGAMVGVEGAMVGAGVGSRVGFPAAGVGAAVEGAAVSANVGALGIL